MKTLTSPFETQKDRKTGAKIRSLLEIDTDGGTLYLSDQNLTVSGQEYVPVVMRFGRVKSQSAPGEDVIRTGEWDLELANKNLYQNQIKPGDEVRFYLWFDGLATADKLLWFTGTVSDDIGGSWYKIRFTSEDIGAWHDKKIGQPLSPVSYPNADPDDWGKIIPEVFGPVKNLPCLWMEAGAATTLTSDISYNYTGAIAVADTSRFPSSGTVVIGEEKISYTSKSATTLAGTITRGVSSTTATSHSRGDAVLENVATVKGLAGNHIFKSLSNARIWPNGLRLQDAVSVDSFATYTLDDSGQATITLSDLGAIRRKVAIAINDQPVHVNNPVTHDHTISGSSQVSLFGNGIASQNSVTNPENAYDQNENTYAFLFDDLSSYYAYLGISFNISTFDGKKITQAVACIRHKTVNYGNDAWRLNLSSVSWTQDLGEFGDPTTQKFIVSALNNQTDWSKLNNLQAEVDDAFSTVGQRVYEMWWEIQYEPDIGDKTININRTIDVSLGGDSVAGISLGRLICDAEGHPDDGAGHYTGSANALIEKPADVFHKILEAYANGPVPHANIDLAESFADAAANLPSSYKFGFAITQQISLLQLLNQLAWQCWCRIFVDAGLWRLVRIKDSGTATKSIDTGTDSLIDARKRLAVTFQQSGLSEIHNTVEVKHNLDLTLGGWGTPDAYQGSSEASDPASITKYQERSESLLAFAVGDNTAMADDLRDKYLARYSVSRKIYIIPLWLQHVDLERGDTPVLTCEQLEIYGRICEVLGVDYDPPIPNLRQGPKTWITLLDLLYILLTGSESVGLGDTGKVDIAAKGSEAIGVGDSGKVNIEAKGSELSVVSDSLDYVTKVVYGFYGGGYDSGSGYNVIDYIETIIANVNAADKGDLTVTRDGLGGVHGNVYGFFGGGWYASTTNYDVIDYIDVTTTTTNAADKGDLTVARHGLAGVHGSTYGFFGGGNDGSDLNIVDYIDVTTTANNASDKGDLTVARRYPAGVYGSTYGFFGGGISLGQDVIDYIDVTITSGNATDKGDLTVARPLLAGVSGSTYGFFGGGYTGVASDVIDYVDVTTTTNNAVDKGDLTLARRGLAGISGDVFGFFGGGRFSYDVIDYIDMTTTAGNATDKSHLTVGRGGLAGVSG